VQGTRVAGKSNGVPFFCLLFLGKQKE